MHGEQSSGTRGPNFRMSIYLRPEFMRMLGDDVDVHVRFSLSIRVKSGKFGRSTKFGQRPCFFHILIIGIIKINSAKKVKILMRRLIILDFHCLQMYVQMYLMSEVTWLLLIPNSYELAYIANMTIYFQKCLETTHIRFTCGV